MQSTKPGLWTMDWTVDCGLDCGLDCRGVDNCFEVGGGGGGG